MKQMPFPILIEASNSVYSVTKVSKRRNMLIIGGTSGQVNIVVFTGGLIRGQLVFLKELDPKR